MYWLSHIFRFLNLLNFFFWWKNNCCQLFHTLISSYSVALYRLSVSVYNKVHVENNLTKFTFASHYTSYLYFHLFRNCIINNLFYYCKMSKLFFKSPSLYIISLLDFKVFKFCIPKTKKDTCLKILKIVSVKFLNRKGYYIGI